MYQALYRKWRPQTFDEVVGQKHITETLKNQVKTGRLSHAYIFIGTRGTGKTTCARILARAVNCENPVDGNPCGVCPACRGISEGTVMDVVELDAASNNGVDNVRALREEAVFSPAAVKKRVYIIDEVHMLSTPAFNALLKILEEPPAHLMFILATTELQKVPATILSRCQRHSFRRIATPEIAEYLEYIAGREGFKLSHEAAELIGRLAEGGVRDALSLLDQCSAAENIDLEAVYSAMGLAGNRRTAELLGHIIDHDPAAALKEFSAMWMDGKDPATLLNELNALMRDTLMLQVAPRGAAALISGGYDGAVLSGFAKQMTTEELICAMDTVQRALNGLRDVKNPKTAVELCLISLCDNVLGESLNRLRARVSRLEEQMKNGLPARSVQSPETEDDGPCPFTGGVRRRNRSMYRRRNRSMYRRRSALRKSSRRTHFLRGACSVLRPRRPRRRMTVCSGKRSARRWRPSFPWICGSAWEMKNGSAAGRTGRRSMWRFCRAFCSAASIGRRYSANLPRQPEPRRGEICAFSFWSGRKRRGSSAVWTN